VIASELDGHGTLCYAILIFLSLIVCGMFVISKGCVWYFHRHDELMYHACLARFCMWVQHVVLSGGG
jgi:hypothetical protein